MHIAHLGHIVNTNINVRQLHKSSENAKSKPLPELAVFTDVSLKIPLLHNFDRGGYCSPGLSEKGWNTRGLCCQLWSVMEQWLGTLLF